MMRLGIIGSREYKHLKWVEEFMYTYYVMNGGDVEFVSGGARGVDDRVRAYATFMKYPYKEFPAAWEKYGKQAGMLRNAELVNYCNSIVAFWDGESPGTKMALELASQQGKDNVVISDSDKKEYYFYESGRINLVL